MAELLDCVAGLDIHGDGQRDTTRRWLALDWLTRAAAPRWLRSAGLAEHASALRRLPALGSQEALSAAGPVVEAAADAAENAHAQAWYRLVTLAKSDSYETDSPVWLAAVDGAQVAMRSTRTVLNPAAQAVGLPVDGRGPTAWRAAVGSITHSAAAISWAAVSDMTTWADWSWSITPPAARALTFTTARTALLPVEVATQGSVYELLAAMHTYTRARS